MVFLSFISDLPVQQSIMQTMNKLNEKLNLSPQMRPVEEIQTTYHACAKAASEGSQFIYRDEKFGIFLLTL